MNLNRFCYSPDAGEGAASAPSAAKTIRMPKLPRKDADLGAVAVTVAARWKETPRITLLWTTAADFEAKAAQYKTAYGGRHAAGGNRSAHVRTLEELDDMIDEGISRVKSYIQDKWTNKETGIAQYSRYGIAKRNRNYELPRDRQQRLEALSLTVAAISADGFDNKDKGKAFWTDIRSQYEAALKTAGDTASAVSSGVSSKNVLRGELIKVMEALQFALRANYPDTYEAEYRAWGWQKEAY